MFPGDGVWQDSSNWSNAVLPVSSEDVLIADYPGDITITVSQGLNSAKSVQCEEQLTLAGGVLAVVETIEVTKDVTLAGGTLQGGTLDLMGGATLAITANSSNRRRAKSPGRCITFSAGPVTCG